MGCTRKKLGFSPLEVVVLTSVLLSSCGREPQARQTHSSSTRSTASSATAARPEATPLTVNPWPTGYVVVTEDDWVPVVDDLGRALHAARAAFAEGAYPRASTELRRGVALLNAQKATATDEQKRAIERAATDLEALAVRMTTNARPEIAQVDRTLAESYGADLRRAWLYLHREELDQVVVPPAPFFSRAVDAFVRGDKATAAAEIREGAAWFRLTADEAENRDDAEHLSGEVDALSTLARRTADGSASDISELKRTFSEVEAAYATYYLHLAEKASRERAWGEAGRRLQTAAQRTEDAVRWSKEEASAAMETALRDSRRVATALTEGREVAMREFESAIERVRRELRTLSPSTPEEHHPVSAYHGHHS